MMYVGHTPKLQARHCNTRLHATMKPIGEKLKECGAERTVLTDTHLLNPRLLIYAALTERVPLDFRDLKAANILRPTPMSPTCSTRGHAGQCHVVSAGPHSRQTYGAWL